MNDAHTTLEELRNILGKFNAARGWDKDHNFNMLAKSVTVESSELMNEVVWMTDEQIDTALQNDPAFTQRVELEIVDILYNVIELARILDMDLSATMEKKLQELETRYPPINQQSTDT